MRLDKFLKVSRLIKRRTVANEACDAGRVMVNGKPAKASTNVKVGDEIEILFGQKSVKVRVTDIQDTTKKEQAKDLFEYISQKCGAYSLTGQSNSTGQHKLILQNRKSGSFTGVTDVVNFDANEIILDTELGRLTIKGKELHVNRLDLQKKEVEIDGTVDMLQYSGTPGRGVFGKWFG